MATKFTFRHVPRTGRYRCFEPRRDEIKFKGVVVGDIFQIGPNTLVPAFKGQEGKFRVILFAKERNITLKRVFNDEQEARDFLNRNVEEILTLYPLKGET